MDPNSTALYRVIAVVVLLLAVYMFRSARAMRYSTLGALAMGACGVVGLVCQSLPETSFRVLLNLAWLATIPFATLLANRGWRDGVRKGTYVPPKPKDKSVQPVVGQPVKPRES